MMTLAEARASIGRSVRYDPPSGGQAQHGVIADVGGTFVYVRFVGDCRAKGASPDRLTRDPE